MLRLRIGLFVLTIPCIVFLSCSSANKNVSDTNISNKGKKFENIKPDELSPGTAKVKAAIKELLPTREKNQKLSIEVIEVLGYGSSTTPLAPGTNLQVILPNSLSEKENLKKDESYILLIKNIITREENSISWIVTDIVK